MNVNASYEEGHLIVAAIRVLEHRHGGRPPTIEEITQLVGGSDEWTGVLVRALAGAGVLRTLKGPFETRVEIADHVGLEALPREEASSGVDREIQEFSARKKKEEEKLRNLFASGDAMKKQNERIEKIADAFKDLQSDTPPRAPLFRDKPRDESS